SCPSSGLIQQVELLNLSSIEIGSKVHYIEKDDNDNGKNDLSDMKNYKHHLEQQFYTSYSSSGLTQQIESLNLSSTEIGSKIHYIENNDDDDDDDNGSTKKKTKIFHK